jgi:SOS response regulatory protein OraA/RecX
MSAARSFVVNSLAARAQSVAEIEAKLAALDVPPDVAAAVIAEARELGYLDDAELAGQLARGFRTRGYGRRRAAQAHRRRGLSLVSETALDAAFGEEEAELAAAALGSRPTGDPKARRRAVAFLVRRGFTPAVAWQVVEARGRDEGRS